jgi:hypothetical protein
MVPEPLPPLAEIPAIPPPSSTLAPSTGLAAAAADQRGDLAVPILSGAAEVAAPAIPTADALNPAADATPAVLQGYYMNAASHSFSSTYQGSPDLLKHEAQFFVASLPPMSTLSSHGQPFNPNQKALKSFAPPVSSDAPPPALPGGEEWLPTPPGAPINVLPDPLIDLIT